MAATILVIERLILMENSVIAVGRAGSIVNTAVGPDPTKPRITKTM